MSTCDCSCDRGDYEAPSVYCASQRKTRKPHSCVECGEVIPIGVTCEYVSGCWDGRWDSHYTCAACAAIRRHYCPHGWIIGNLREQLLNCLDIDYLSVPETDT
jgi:hypothetical protein